MTFQKIQSTKLIIVDVLKIVRKSRSCGFESRLKFNCQYFSFFIVFFFKFYFFFFFVWEALLEKISINFQRRKTAIHRSQIIVDQQNNPNKILFSFSILQFDKFTKKTITNICFVSMNAIFPIPRKFACFCGMSEWVRTPVQKTI